MTEIHALIQYYKGAYHTERINRKPLNTSGLLMLSEPLAPNVQVIFWYPQDLSNDTARWLAKDFAVDLKRELANSGK